LGLPWEAIIKQKIKTPEIKVKRSNEKLEAFLTGFLNNFNLPFI
jgi:hypothetical protein